MLSDSVELLSCRACGSDGSFDLSVVEANDVEVRVGTLTCADCGDEFAIESGIAELMHQPPEHVEKEAAGLDRFADLMDSDGWGREKILQLPHIEDGYWFAQSTAMDFVLDRFDFKPGERILDVGSNTCWASNQFARRGMHAFALDITKTLMQGLYTAEWWMEEHDVYIERVLGSMFDIPLADESMDYVFCCEVLHHNDSDELPQTFKEIFRVLKPGGTLIVVNETIKTLLDRVGNHAEEAGVAEFEGYEHAHWAWEYFRASKKAGFSNELVPPPHSGFFKESGMPSVIESGQSTLGAYKKASRHVLKNNSLGRRAMLAWKTYVGTTTNLSFIATKPR